MRELCFARGQPLATPTFLASYTLFSMPAAETTPTAQPSIMSRKKLKDLIQPRLVLRRGNSFLSVVSSAVSSPRDEVNEVSASVKDIQTLLHCLAAFPLIRMISSTKKIGRGYDLDCDSVCLSDLPCRFAFIDFLLRLKERGPRFRIE